MKVINGVCTLIFAPCGYLFHQSLENEDELRVGEFGLCCCLRQYYSLTVEVQRLEFYIRYGQFSEPALLRASLSKGNSLQWAL